MAMGWVNDALAVLAEGRTAKVRVFGGSMRGRIESGQQVTLAPIPPSGANVGDVVLVSWKGNYLLHLVLQKDGDRFLIGNNLGKTNGWVDRADLRGLVVGVHD